MKNDDEEPDATGLRHRAERSIAQSAATAPAFAGDTVALLHELQVHQLELEMQNESLRQSQAETEAARQALETLNAQLEERVIARTAELAAARDAAVAASLAKSDFLDRMSHELRTPLNGIMGMAELARRRATDPGQEELLVKALRSGHHLLGLIETLLDLADGEAGRLKLVPAPFPVARSLDEVIGEMAGPAGAAGMTISVEVDPSLPVTLVGDAGRIKQLLRIFIGNAIKFAPPGRITVRARMREDGPSGCLLRLEVADEGVPLAPAQCARLFEPFTQADESLTREHGGAGIGLALSRHLARLMGGEAGVTAGEGVGNVFWADVRLPVAQRP
ncbi:MAG: hypothetical protein IPL06_21075 [Betaproteobacteria bacterium]|nr:hypothetical protein [Betaproteobacteria bacterium]